MGPKGVSGELLSATGSEKIYGGVMTKGGRKGRLGRPRISRSASGLYSELRFRFMEFDGGNMSANADEGISVTDPGSIKVEILE